MWYAHSEIRIENNVFDRGAALVLFSVAISNGQSPGSIVSWGRDDYGQVSGTPTGNGFVKIASGWLCGLALTSEGRIIGWGENDSGQLNIPRTPEFKAISGGGRFTLALKSDGTIVGWGSSDFGQLDGMPDTLGWVAISAGGGHSIARDADGYIRSWGHNSNGQVSGTPTEYGYTAVAAGGDHSLALRSDGSIVGWGKNWSGQASPPAGTGFIAIAAGEEHSLALRSDGSIVGWGKNNYGQASPPSGTGFIAIAAQADWSLALRSDGSLVAWGSFAPSPPISSGFVAISAGGQHGSALRGCLIKAAVVDGHGTVSPSVQVVKVGASAGITIMSDNGYQIASITDNGQSMPVSYQYVIKNSQADHNVVVKFERGCDAPSIQKQPRSQPVPYGQSVNLTIAAGSGLPFTYQWYQGVSGDTSYPIAGATSDSYGISSLRASTVYWVKVRNDCGSTDSDTAIL